MILNLFGDKDDAFEFYYGPISKMIQNLRSIYLAGSGNPIDFTEWLKNQGVEMIGTCVSISDEFELMAKLKYSE